MVLSFFHEETFRLNFLKMPDAHQFLPYKILMTPEKSNVASFLALTHFGLPPCARVNVADSSLTEKTMFIKVMHVIVRAARV